MILWLYYNLSSQWLLVLCSYRTNRNPGLLNSIQFNPFPNKSRIFLRVCSTSLLKTLSEKEKLLIMSNFSFFPSVFSTLLDIFLPFSSNSKLSSANSLSLEESKICYLGKGEPETAGRICIFYNMLRLFSHTTCFCSC